MTSLRTKLIAGIFLLLLVAFGLSSVLLINQKTDELAMDTYGSVKSFSDLTAPTVVELYERYLSQDNFVYYNREIQKMFDKTEEVVGIGLATYDGQILYDSSEEEAKQRDGEDLYAPESMIDRIQATHPSYRLDDGRVVYVRTTVDGYVDYLNTSEELIDPIESSDRITDVIYPYGTKYAVLYAPSYAVLEARVQAMWVRIVLLALFAVLIGMAYAYFFSTSMTRPLKSLREKATLLGEGDFSVRVDNVKTKDEVGVLATTFNQMAGDLEKSMDARAYQERVGKELELAAGIQQDLLPKENPKVPGLDIAAGIIPADEVGGDVYDYIAPDEDNLYGYVGDVTGHGVPAGLLVSVTSALIHSYSHLQDPKQVLIETNKIIKQKTRANMFVTLILWHWNVKTKKLTLVSAGHEVALKYSAGPVKTDELDKGGIALGMMPDISALIKDQPVELEPKDCIILYTDGVPEAWRNEKEQYGMPEFKRVVTQSCDLPSAEAIKMALLADVKQWTDGFEQKDDITVMVLKRV
jgi:serine phosphatase RsbU (regulator of sigma subunit)